MELDIRDFESGQTYWVITSDAKGGRCIFNGMFIAAWSTKDSARAFALTLGEGHHVVKQVKS